MARRPSLRDFFASRGRRQVSSQELAVISCDQTLTKRIKSVTIRLQLLKECFHGREQVQGLTYKGHPLRRVDNLIYYGTMAEKYIIMMQILNTKKEQDMEVATKVSIQLQLTDPELKSRDRVVKKSEKDSLYAAMDIATVWLDRALAGKL